MPRAKEDVLPKYAYVYSSASGPSSHECAYLGHRYDPDVGLRPDEAEAWVLDHTPKAGGSGFSTAIHYGQINWFTMLWRSPKARVYVSDAFGTLHFNPDLTSSRTDELWTTTELAAMLAGVWGLDDRCVFAWGTRDRQDQMFRWDGKKWNPMSSPGRVVRMHGLHPDLLFAVGVEGLVSRWDGRAWHRAQVPTKQTLSGICVAAAEEYYASGQGGTLLEGSPHGWQQRAEWKGALHDVAVFRDTVWIAGAQDGLLKLAGKSNKLSVAKPNIKAISFDARNKLVITAPEKIAETPDGASFTSCGQGLLEEYREDEEPLWLLG